MRSAPVRALALPRRSGHYALVAIERRRIVDLRVVRLEPDDFEVTFSFDTGGTDSVRGRDRSGLDAPFVDAFDLWTFLVSQDTPPELLDRELSLIQSDWDRFVARRLPQPQRAPSNGVSEAVTRALRARLRGKIEDDGSDA